LDGTRAIQHIGRHQSAMLGKSSRQDTREFQPAKVVTVCDHLRFFDAGQEKSGTVGKAIRIALYGLVAGLGRDAI